MEKNDEKLRCIPKSDRKEASKFSRNHRQNTNTARMNRYELSCGDDSSGSSEIELKPKRQHTMVSKSHVHQDCLAKSIQKHIQPLVETLPFSQSEVPDVLVDGCLTEDECSSIRQIPKRKDQIRQLVLLIKGRSYETMETFLESIKCHCSETVKNIRKDYFSKIEARCSGTQICPIKKMKSNVDIKYVADYLWGKFVISDVLFDDIIKCDRPAGDQNTLWEQVIKSCKENKKIIDLSNALKRNGHYMHIADGIQDHVYALNYDCTCEYHTQPHYQFAEQIIQSGTRDSATSYSAASSESSLVLSHSDATECEEGEPQHQLSFISDQSSNPRPISEKLVVDTDKENLKRLNSRFPACCFPCFVNLYAIEDDTQKVDEE